MLYHKSSLSAAFHASLKANYVCCVNDTVFRQPYSFDRCVQDRLSPGLFRHYTTLNDQTRHKSVEDIVDNDDFKKELSDVMEDMRNTQRRIAKDKYIAWKERQCHQDTTQTTTPNDKKHHCNTEYSGLNSNNTHHINYSTQQDNTCQQSNVYSTMRPKDTHFNIGHHIFTDTESETMIQQLEESFQLQLTTSPYMCIQTAQSIEELAMMYHQYLKLDKAVTYYKKAISLYKQLAVDAYQQDNHTSVCEPTIHKKCDPCIINPEKEFLSERTIVQEYDTSRHAPNICVDSTMTMMTPDQSKITPQDTGPQSIASYDIARCLSYLGVCYRDAGKLNKSKIVLIEALNMKYATVGQYHESTAESLNNLGALYHSQDIYNKAIECYQDAIHILIGTLGGEAPTNLYLAMLYYNLGIAFHSNKSNAPAVISLLKSLRICNQTIQLERVQDLKNRINDQLLKIKKESLV